MKRTFLAKRNALLSSRSISWGLCALVLSILLLLLRLLAPNIFWHAFSPLFETSDAIGTEWHIFFSSFGNAAMLTATNETLASENAALAAENQTLLQKVSDEEVLLGTTSASKQTSILAGVVARPPESPYDTLTVAEGSAAGVKLGMEAFGENSVPVGIVTSVLSDFSRVTLFSSPSAVTNGSVGKSNMPVTLTGVGGGAVEASVARSANVAVGDIVSIPGPGTLPIGSVVRVDSDPISPVVTLRVMLTTNPFSLSWVTLRATGITGVTFATSTTP